MGMARLVDGLTFEWRCERRVEALLRSAQEDAALPEISAALAELITASRARRSRVERRLEALGARPVLAGVPEAAPQLAEALERALASVRATADRCAALAELSRQLRDPETAFTCELNRIGAEEAAGLLDVLLGAEVDRLVRLTGDPRPDGELPIG